MKTKQLGFCTTAGLVLGLVALFSSGAAAQTTPAAAPEAAASASASTPVVPKAPVPAQPVVSPTAPPTTPAPETTAAPAAVQAEPAPKVSGAGSAQPAPASPPAEDGAEEDVYPFPEGEKHRVSAHALNNDKSRFRLGNGLEFVSEDGDFSMMPRLRAQFRYTWDKSSDDNGELADSTQSFMIRRARLQFKGHFWGKHNKYKTEIAISPRDLGTRSTAQSRAPNTGPLLDWYLDFTYLRDMSLRVGQYKVPFNRQRVISSGDLQLVDRSIVNSRFTVDRDLGVEIRSKDLFGLDLLKYYLGVYTGEGRNTAHQDDFGVMYLGRVEVLPFGMDGFKDYKEADLERSATPKLSIALGYAYLDDAKYERGILGGTPADGGTTDIGAINADVMFKYAGFSLFSEAVLRSGDRQRGDATETVVAEDGTEEEIAVPEAAALDGYGVMAQLGYLVPQTRFEVAARGAVIRASDEESGLSDEDELGVGVSYYFAHHPFKIQGDYFLYQEGPAQATADEKISSHQVRVQLQAAY